MSIPDRLPHARHNEETCRFLFASNDHFDWVVTTAFYSALHYVQSRMFPYPTTHPNTDEYKLYNSFAEYYIDVKLVLNQSKHEVTAHLVDAILPEVAPRYRSLLDKSMTVRYNDFSVQQKEAAMCIRRLEIIRDACVPPEPEPVA